MTPDQIIKELEQWAYNERPGTGDWKGTDDDYGMGYLDAKEDTIVFLEEKLAELKEQIKRDAIGRYGSTTNTDAS